MADEQTPVVPAPDPTNLPVAPEIKVNHKENFWMRRQDALLKKMLLSDIQPIGDIIELRAVERRYPEEEHKPGLISQGAVTATRLTNWEKTVVFDVIAYDEASMLQIEIKFARFYLTAATWVDNDLLIEHYVSSSNFVWPIRAVEVFAGFTPDEFEKNILMDAKAVTDPRAWEHFEEASVNHTTLPPYWSRPPAIWEEQLRQDTEWLGEWVHNRVWDKVYKLDQFLEELFLVPRDPIFMGSQRAKHNPFQQLGP